MEDTTPEPGRLSRRSLVKSAAVVAAAGTATLAVGGAASASTAASGTDAAAVPGARAESTVGTIHGPLVVHVHDAATGELDIYSGEHHVSVQDRELAARLAKLAR